MGSYTARPGPIPGTTLWRVTADQTDGTQFRVIPDAAMDVVCSSGRLLFAGPDSAATLVPSSPGAVTWGLRFAPGIAHSLVGVPADELVDQRVELNELVVVAPATLDAAWHDPARALERVASALWQRQAPDPAALALARSLDRAARAGASVGEMVEQHHLSERTLRRLSGRVFGYGPKTLSAIHRLQRALRHARSGASLAEVAAFARYTDQSHLNREARRLAGVAFRTLAAAHRQ